MIRQVHTNASRYHYSVDDGIQIYIGRSARANHDLLREIKETLDDRDRAFWLHLADHSSSHGFVVVPDGCSEVVTACKFVKEWLLSIAKTKGLRDDVVLCDVRDVQPTKTVGCVVNRDGILMSNSRWTEKVRLNASVE